MFDEFKTQYPMYTPYAVFVRVVCDLVNICALSQKDEAEIETMHSNMESHVDQIEQLEHQVNNFEDFAEQLEEELKEELEIQKEVSPSILTSPIVDDSSQTSEIRNSQHPFLGKGL
jgi:hypothetical protein